MDRGAVDRGLEGTGAANAGCVRTPVVWSDYFDNVARLMSEAALALDCAHTHGVIHRDVKPSNLILAPDGRLCVTDFGLARIVEEPGMTLSGEFVGSPAYMSPEQAGGGTVPVDHRSDVYSLGATLHELLTFQPLFSGERRDEVLLKILHNEPVRPRLRNRQVPRDLETICLRAIEKAPGRRYQSAAALSLDLLNFVDRVPISARRTGTVGRVCNWIGRRPTLAGLISCVVVALALAWFFAHSASASRQQLTPETAEDYLFLGLAESYLDPDRARHSLDEAIRRRRLPAAFVVRAEVRAHQAKDTGDMAEADGAVADAELARRLLPDNAAALLVSATAHGVAADVYERLGRPEQGLVLRAQAGRDVAALAPYSHLPTVAYKRARFSLDAGDAETAFEILQDAQARTENTRVNYTYALLLYRRDALDEGLAVLERRTHRSHNEDLLRILILRELPDGPAKAREAYHALREQYPAGLSALFGPIVPLVWGERAMALADSREIRQQPDRLPRLRHNFYATLLDFNCGDVDSERLLAAAGRSQWDQCESHFFIALHALAEGRREEAKRHFRASIATRCSGFLALDWSQAFLARLDRDLTWPRWIPARDD